MINHSDILQLCRLCLVEEKVNHPIFEEAGDLRSIFLKITSCLPISIREDDSLPKNICDSCSSKLDSFYQFWNETANAEKQLLQWLKESALTPLSQTVQTETIKNKMDTTEVKEEIDVIENKVDAVEMSSEAQTYILQQQQLPYSSTPPKILPTLNETDEPAPKRPKRASAMKAMEQMESEDDDDEDFGAENYTKSESENSDKEDGTYPEGPSTSMDDQPGPSGMGKGSTDAPLVHCMKSCSVQLDDVRHLLDDNGIYVVPRNRSKCFTCYKCFEKFHSKGELTVHKEIHELYDEGIAETGSDNDSIGSEESSATDPGGSPVTVTKKAQQKISQPILISVEEEEEKLKIPMINNISIKCGTCLITLCSIDELINHSPLDSEKKCSFTCNVCPNQYDTPSVYLNHILQHNDFIKKCTSMTKRKDIPVNYVTKKYRYICVMCGVRYEDCYQLRRHEIEVHGKKKDPQIYRSDTNKPKLCVIEEVKSMAMEEDNESSVIDSEMPIIKNRKTPNKKGKNQHINIKKKVSAPSMQRNSLDRTAMPKNNSKEQTENLSFNILKHTELLQIEEQSSRIAVQENTKPTDGTKSLVCDICFDVFSDLESFEEHTEFHGTLTIDLTGSETNLIISNKPKCNSIQPSSSLAETPSRTRTPKVFGGFTGKQLSSKSAPAHNKATKNTDLPTELDEGCSSVSPRDSNRIIKMGTNVEPSKDTKQCPDCKIIYKKRSSLKSHLYNRLNCPSCDYKTCRATIMRAHILLQHQMYFCWKCKQILDTAEEFSKHYNSQHKCTKCNKLVTYLNSHTCNV